MSNSDELKTKKKSINFILLHLATTTEQSPIKSDEPWPDRWTEKHTQCNHKLDMELSPLTHIVNCINLHRSSLNPGVEHNSKLTLFHHGPLKIKSNNNRKSLDVVATMPFSILSFFFGRKMFTAMGIEYN